MSDHWGVEVPVAHGAEEPGVPEGDVPASAATSQYPSPSGVAMMWVIGALRCWPAMAARAAKEVSVSTTAVNSPRTGRCDRVRPEVVPSLRPWLKGRCRAVDAPASVGVTAVLDRRNEPVLCSAFALVVFRVSDVLVGHGRDRSFHLPTQVRTEPAQESAPPSSITLDERGLTED